MLRCYLLSSARPDTCRQLSPELQEVRRQLAPWEQQISEVQSRLGVATSERDMLQKSHADAKQRLQVQKIVSSAAVATNYYNAGIDVCKLGCVQAGSLYLQSLRFTMQETFVYCQSSVPSKSRVQVGAALHHSHWKHGAFEQELQKRLAVVAFVSVLDLKGLAACACVLHCRMQR